MKPAHNNFSDYILYPGIAMLLGWGLRGYIGGGPFGAMIPGAFIALTLNILLGFRGHYSAMLTVFSILGVGLGGEMTYGQTLGFLRSNETAWFGTIGTTVKGAVWGLSAGLFIAVGLLHKRISRKVIVYAFILYFAGLLIGFKLINDPKLIYFSDPVNKPRSESWAALMMGGIFAVWFLYNKVRKEDFKILWHFVWMGTTGGALGFGIGGLWLTLGSNLPNAWITGWWKIMEFSFGLSLGAFIGWAAWYHKDAFQKEKKQQDDSVKKTIFPELALLTILALAVYWILPGFFSHLSGLGRYSYEHGWIYGISGDVLRIASNYAFYGFIMIIIAYLNSAIAWQIAISMTFIHSSIDLMRDLLPETGIETSATFQYSFIFISTLIVASLCALIIRKSKQTIPWLLYLLVWACMFISYIKFSTHISIEGILATDAIPLIFRVLFVHIVFTFSAIYTTYKTWQLQQIS